MKDVRLLSLDALRGFDMFFIMGLAGFITAVCSLFPGGESCWLSAQMEHAPWEGFRHHDTIFPLFLFLAGVSFPFSYSKSRTKAGMYRKIFRRCILLILLGLVYNHLLNFDFAHLRIFSVLGRIGLAWMFAAIIYMNTRPLTRGVICLVILVGYSLLLGIPAPDAAGAAPLSEEGNIVGYVDRTLFGRDHLYHGGCFDPEGLLSTLPAIVTALLGMFAGELVRVPEEKISGVRKTLWLLGAAAVMLVAGLVVNRFQPCIKKLWDCAFVLYAGAWSAGIFALFYWTIDVRGWRGWAFPFAVVGMNSITIYMVQAVISMGFTTRFFLSGLMSLCPDPLAKVVFSAGYMTLCWLLLYFLYRKNIFLKV